MRRDARAWVVRLTSGQATDADAWALSQWRARSAEHEAAFKEAAQLWRRAGTAGAPVPQPGKLPGSWTRRSLGGLALAAACGGAYWGGTAGGFWPSVSELLADQRTNAGERRRLVLDDGSAVEMNARTSLSVRFAAAERRIDLVMGEALFSVSPDATRPFAVRAAEGTATGTVFGVRTLPGGARVLCLEGRVRIEQGGTAGEIKASEALAYGPAGIGSVGPFDPAVSMAWRSGLLVFRDTPLVDVVAELNRYRPGRLVLTSAIAATRRVSGVFHLDRPDEVLAYMERVLGVRRTASLGGLVLLR